MKDSRLVVFFCGLLCSKPNKPFLHNSPFKLRGTLQIVLRIFYKPRSNTLHTGAVCANKPHPAALFLLEWGPRRTPTQCIWRGERRHRLPVYLAEWYKPLQPDCRTRSLILFWKLTYFTDYIPKNKLLWDFFWNRLRILFAYIENFSYLCTKIRTRHSSYRIRGI